MEEEKDSFTLLYIFFGVIIILWISAWVFLYDIKERGTFGDMFGSVNALFSGLALAGIIFTILLQKRELSLQRKELRQTRKEFITQNETLKLQRFENTLFNMIDNHYELIDNLSYKREGINLEKREVLRHAAIILKKNFTSYKKGKKSDIGGETANFDDAKKHLVDAYKNFYFDIYDQRLSNYFRNIYHIFKLILLSDLIKPDQMAFYASLVRAQLSFEELYLIFYNSLITDLGYPNFLYLIDRLDILQNFDFDLIRRLKFHEEIYLELKKGVQPEFYPIR